MTLFDKKNASYTVTAQDGTQREYLMLDITDLSKTAKEMVKNAYAMALEATRPPGSGNWVPTEESPLNGSPATDESENDIGDDDDAEQFIETTPTTEPAKRGKNSKNVAPRNILDQVEAQNKEALAKSQIPPAGWSPEATRKSLDLLPKPQKDVLLQAVTNGGQVSRAETYTAAGFEPTRSLKGFTRPVRGVMTHLKKQGLLPDNAKPLLDTIYDPASTTYKPVQGFVVPLEVVVYMRNMGLGLDPSANA